MTREEIDHVHEQIARRTLAEADKHAQAAPQVIASISSMQLVAAEFIQQRLRDRSERPPVLQLVDGKPARELASLSV